MKSTSKSSTRGIFFAILVLNILMAGPVFASKSGVQNSCTCEGGSGGGIPSPFSFNSKVELADGEYYRLEGVIVATPDGQSAFQINLSEAPWLASEDRSASPYYPILTDSVELKKRLVTQWQNTPVILSAQARGQVIMSDQGTLRYVIYLIPQKNGISPASCRD